MIWIITALLMVPVILLFWAYEEDLWEDEAESCMR